MLNEEVSKLGEESKRFILLQSLYKYLNDIISLENKMIIKACDDLTNNKIKQISFPFEFKKNAYTVIIDEYYDIFLAQMLTEQLDENFKYLNLQRDNFPIADSVYSVEKVLEILDSKYHSLFKLFAVCIFETTLIRELVEFF